MQEFPALQKLNANYAAKGLQVIGITSDEADSIKKVKAQHKATFNIVIDADNKVADKFGVSAMPRTLLIDKNGVVQVDLEEGKEYEEFVAELKKVGL